VYPLGLVFFLAGFAMDEDENEWEALNRTNWRGLGLTDPIKGVEVCSSTT
jgi:hypothetical protein